MEDTPEYRMLSTCTADLVNAIAQDVEVFATKFHDQELITEAVYNTVTDTKKKQDNAERASDIVENILTKGTADASGVLNKVVKVLKDLHLNNTADGVLHELVLLSQPISERSPELSIQALPACNSSPLPTRRFSAPELKVFPAPIHHPPHYRKKNNNIPLKCFVKLTSHYFRSSKFTENNMKQIITGFILCNAHIPILMKKLHDLAYKWEEIGIALKMPLHMRENAARSSTDIIKLYSILEIFINSGGPTTLSPTLTNLNNSLHSPIVNATQYQITQDDLKFDNKVISGMINLKYRRAYEDIMKNEKQMLKVLFAKLIFLGPPERGKTLTRLRLEKEILNMESDPKYHNNPSTLLAKNKTHVITDLSETAALLSEKGWKPLKGKREEVQLLYQLFFKLKEDMKLQIPASQSSSLLGSDMHSNDPKSSPLIDKSHKSTELSPSTSTEATSISAHNITQILDIFDESLASGTWEELAGQLESVCLLYMKDTGGQPELMDMLPALIIGPALYLLFCRYGDNLDETYKISLRGVENGRIPDRMSISTVRQSLTSALSSIFSMQSYSTTVSASDNNLFESLMKNPAKSKAYIVGTHKDKVSSQEMIDFDKNMQEVVNNTIFTRKDIVHYVSKDGFESSDPKDEMPEGMERLIYPIDNHHGTAEEIEGLQKFIQEALNTFPRPEIPARWLPFSLLLRFTRERYVDLKTCYRYGKNLRMDEAETEVALWFFHHFTGIIYYFPNVPELKNFVITDTQLVFDSISRLIFENGVDFCQGAGEAIRRVGQISFADIKKMSSDMFPPRQMKALLKHFRIIAPLRKSLTEELFIDKNPSQLYFMPCVLQNFSEEELDVQIQKVSRNSYHLKISFLSGFVPIGLFPSMIASLVGQASELNLMFPFELLNEQNIRKNFVQFSYGKDGDTLVFVSRPTCFEIIVARPTSCRTPARQVCHEVREIVEETLDDITECTETILDTYNMKTVSRRYQISFDCPEHREEGHLCSIKKGDKDPHIMWCISSKRVRTRVEMTEKQLVWFGKESVSYPDMTAKNICGHRTNEDIPKSRRMKLQNCEGHQESHQEFLLQAIDSNELDIDSLGSIYRELKNPLTPKWQEFAVQLGLNYDATETIKRDNPSNSSQCLQETLARWLYLDYNYHRHGKPSWRRIAEVVVWLSPNLFQDIVKTHSM